MARIRIDFPEEELSFTTRLPVLIQHVNYGGHLGNDAILSLVHECRIRYLQHLGCSELDAFGTGLIMTDSAIIFRGEGFYGDGLEVAVGAGDLTSRGFDLFYKMHCEREGNNILIAEVKTGMLCFDYKTRKPAIMPEILRKKLRGEIIKSK